MSKWRWSLAAGICGSSLLLTAARADAQAGPGATSPQFRSPAGRQVGAAGSNPALEFFGGARLAAYQQPGRSVTPPAPLPAQTAAAAKPFSYAPQSSSVTPYLALDQRESDFGLPNYYLYVRPQFEQQAVNQRQQAQYRRLQQQVRRSQPGAIIPQGTTGGIPTTGHSTQFMNSGGYYPGLR